MSASGALSILWTVVIIVIVLIVVVVLLRALSLLVVLPEVYAQQNGTPTITFQSPNTGGVINPSLQFIPQQAWVQTVPPANVPNQNINDNDSPQGLSEVLVSLAASGGAFVLAKMNADKNHKKNAAEILKTKENTKELARVTYDMNPEAAAKIDDAPAVKIQTLTNDVNDYAEKVAKI